MNKFLKGKMYNRCRRGHTLLATAIRGIHFQQYVKLQNVSSSKLQKLKEWSETENTILCNELATLITRYQLFTKGALNGEHGKTAQFWMKYVAIVELHLVMHRSMKTNDAFMHLPSMI